MDLSVSAAHRRRGYAEDDTGGGGSNTTPPQTPPTTGGGRVDAHVDRGLADAVRHRTPRETPAGDGILYVGLNETSAPTELEALRRASPGGVTAIFGQAGAKLVAKCGTFDLADDAEVGRFAKELVAYYGLPEATGAEIEKLLLGATLHDKQGRDELAKIALSMARAESGGEAMPSRLVLSGHSTTVSIYGETAGGEGLGKFAFDDIRTLAKIFPAAAKQVEDIHLGACFSAEEVEKNELWKKSFPNLKTMWGYSGLSPLAPVGDLATWSRATVGRSSKLSVDTFHAKTGAMGWSDAGGMSDPAVSTAELRSRVARAAEHFDGLVAGDIETRGPYSSPAREDYEAYRSLSGRPGSSDAECAALRHRADVLHRVRFYEHGVRDGFQRAHGAQVGQAFLTLGLPVVDFSKLSRREAMTKIDEFRRAVQAAPNPLASDVLAASRHLDALATLDPRAIHEDWCQ